MSMLQIMYEGKKPARRLQAARKVILLAKESIDLEDFVAEVAQAQRLPSRAQLGELPTNQSRKASTPGHGSKLPRKKEKAIEALLTQRTIADAARKTGIGSQTMYRWLRDPAFLTDYVAAAGAVYGSAMRMVQQRQVDAVSIIKNFTGDFTIPEETRFEADVCVIHAGRANLLEGQTSCIAGMESANANAEPERTSHTIGANLHRRLQRIKALLESNKPSRLPKEAAE